MIRVKPLKKLILCSIMIFLAVLVMAGCNKTAETTKVTIDDRVEIPSNGVITKEQFEAFAGTDRVIDFEGTSGSIKYIWSYPGKNIHNPQQMDLTIDFITDNLEHIKKISGGAAYAIGMELKGEGLITVPTLTIILPERWDADTAVFCKESDGSALRICDADIEVKEDTTKISVEVREVGDTYYIVAGQAKTSTTKAYMEKNQTDLKDGMSEKPADMTEQSTNVDYKETDKKTVTEKKNETTCTLSISCAEILNNMDKLNSAKKQFVPKDGWILRPTEIKIEKGESVFDLLLAVCKAQKIHMEHSYTPIYGSVYIEGINQLYEFDCGDLSGWRYIVDGWNPNYGCDKYILSGGEHVELKYACDLGRSAESN